MAGAAAATLGHEMTSENAGHVWQSSKTGVWVTPILKHNITSGLSMECELRNTIKNLKAQLFLVTMLRPPCYCLITQSNVHLRTLNLLFPCQGQVSSRYLQGFLPPSLLSGSCSSGVSSEMSPDHPALLHDFLFRATMLFLNHHGFYTSPRLLVCFLLWNISSRQAGDSVSCLLLYPHSLKAHRPMVHFCARGAKNVLLCFKTL